MKLYQRLRFRDTKLVDGDVLVGATVFRPVAQPQDDTKRLVELLRTIRDFPSTVTPEQIDEAIDAAMSEGKET